MVAVGIRYYNEVGSDGCWVLGVGEGGGGGGGVGGGGGGGEVQPVNKRPAQADELSTLTHCSFLAHKTIRPDRTASNTPANRLQTPCGHAP